MPESVDRIRLEDVDLEEELYSCSYPLLAGPLVDSIRRRGILQPVKLLRRGARFAVVSGLRRARAARACGLDALPCSILEPPVPGDGELFLINLEDNLSSRPLNLFERARGVKRLVEDLPGLDESIKGDYLGLLGVKGGGDAIPRYLALEALENEVKRYVLDRNLPERFAALFTELPAPERRVLVGLAEELRFTASQLREIVHSGREVAAREGKGFEAVLRSLTDGLDPSLKDTSRRRDGYLALLRERRLPDYTRVKRRLEACLAGINGRPGIRVSAPPYLEGDALTVRIAFQSPEELATRAGALVDFAREADLVKAFDLLG